jgi:hypothetical protein
MELDPRIYKDRKPLNCFDIQKAKKFLGAKGYFSPYIDYFSDLKLTHYGTLLDIDDKSTTPYGLNDDEYYVFFLPSAWVKNTEEQQQFAEDSLKLSMIIHSLFRHSHPAEIIKRHEHEREQFLEDVFKRVLSGDPWNEVR